MARKEKHISLVNQFIELCKAGYALLGENIQAEIQAFVKASQNSDGGFTDRAHQSDLYYSLFGFWLSLAIGHEKQLEGFKNYVSSQNVENQKEIDGQVLKLIQLKLFPEKPFNFPSLLKRDHSMNFSYRMFILLLLFDTRYGNKPWLNFLFKLGLHFYRTTSGVPCSMLAALLVARYKVGLKTQQQAKQLLRFFDGHGFRSFEQVQSPDMLSTAVALFALRFSNADLRLIAPASLDFIQENYTEGAFLSGDGDGSRDLEYTFYGLLALGALAKIN